MDSTENDDGQGQNLSDTTQLQGDGELPALPLDDQEDQGNEVDRIDRFARSEIFVQRLYHVCYMAEAAQRSGYKGCAPVFVPLCRELAVDDEPEIRQALAEQLPQLARIFALDGSAESQQDVSFLLQTAHTLLTDDFEEVQLAAEQAFSEMVHVVRAVGGRMENDLLSIVLALATSEEESQRVCAANLLTGLPEGLSPLVFQERANPHIMELACDSEFRVRKAVALGLPRCFKALEEHSDLVEGSVLPVYKKLSQDAVWAVRMACAEGIVRIAEVIAPDTRASHLASVIEQLAADPSNWVRDSALQMLGPFLSLLQGTNELSKHLVSLFTSMAEPYPHDNRLPFYCAFNFPAVVQGIGAERWGEVEGAYRSLIKSEQASVRRTLAYSLHELGKVLGGDLSQAHLMPAFRAFITDTDEIRMGVARNLVIFIEVLPAEMRDECVQMLCSVSWKPSVPAPRPPLPPSPGASGRPRLEFPPFGALDSERSLEGDNPTDAMEPAFGSPERTTGLINGVGDLNPAENAEPGEVEATLDENSDTHGVSLRPSLKPSGKVTDGMQGLVKSQAPPSARVVDCRSLWHLRLLIIEQIQHIAALLDLRKVQAILMPFVLELCRDPIAAVRSEAARQFGNLLLLLIHSRNTEIQNIALPEAFHNLKELSSSLKFRERQMFCLACLRVVHGLEPYLFERELLPSLLRLAKDPVANVRIMASEALAEAVFITDSLRLLPIVEAAITELQADSDPDVAFAASHRAPVEHLESPSSKVDGENEAAIHDVLGSEVLLPPIRDLDLPTSLATLSLDPTDSAHAFTSSPSALHQSRLLPFDVVDVPMPPDDLELGSDSHSADRMDPESTTAVS